MRHHAQPLSSDTQSSEILPRSKLSSGIDTASLVSSDVQTAYLAGNHFSEVLLPTLVAPIVRRSEYFTADNSSPPTPNFADYPLRVHGIIIYEPQSASRFTSLTERFINNNDTISGKRKDLELPRLRSLTLEIKLETKIRFQGLNFQPVFQVAKLEHTTTPAFFIVTHIDFNRNTTLPDLTKGKIMFNNPYSGLEDNIYI